MNTLALSTMLALAAGAIALGQSQQFARSVRDGVYSSAQASLGKTEYDAKCASCHGSMASATPDMAPLLNDYMFQDTWKDRSVAQFFERIRKTMPQDQPGTLSPPATASIVAYILSANKLPPGDADLPVDVETLKDIRLDAIEP